MIGPRTTRADVAAAQIPKARARCWPSNAFVMIASEPGTSSAPAAPWNSRAMVSSSSVGASPHTTDVTPNKVRPIPNTRRRP